MLLPDFKIRQLDCDVVIIGSGGGGLMLAHYLSSLKRKIVVISKVHPLQSHTAAAQGGINASLNKHSDNWKYHMYDTVKGGDWLGDQDAIEILCKKASKAIEDLIKLGVPFCKDDYGEILQKTYGGQTLEFGKGGPAHRVCSVADKTGAAILNSIYKSTKDSEVEFLNYHYALELLVKNQKCYGLVSWDIASGILYSIKAQHVIVATGGYSQIYETNTSANICTGDGNGLAVRASLMLQDMEFIQFHPTAIHEIGILVTEAARSAGGKLINSAGTRFMKHYAPTLLELASRDVVARAISSEITLGNGCGPKKDHVFLDLTHLSQKVICRHLPTVIENCKQFLNINPTENLIPISPAAHYTMGGIPTDSNCQVIDFAHSSEGKPVEGLWALGEAACISLHGANRLGCNSLLELIVFAKIIAKKITNCKNTKINSLDYEDISEKSIKKVKIKFNKVFSSSSKPSDEIKATREYLQSVLSKYVGIVRNKDTLTIALNKIYKIKQQFSKLTINNLTLSWNNDLVDYFELENLIISSELTVYSAISRNESRGAHYRNDFPKRNDQFYLHHSLVGYDIDNNLIQTKKSVRFRTSKEANTFFPEDRTY